MTWNRDRAAAEREARLDEREASAASRETAVAEREELARLREAVLRAQEEGEAAKLDRERLLAEVREANEHLVLAMVQMQELAEAERRAVDRVRFLADVSELLASSLDVEASLAALTALAVAHLADWCAIELIREDAASEQIALSHVEADRVDLVHELRRRYPPDPDGRSCIGQVLRTGQSDWNAHISDELLVGVARDDEHLRRLRDLGMASYVVVAIKTPARILGALTLVAAGSQRSYGVEDVRLAEEVARRAAAALENTRLFRQAQDAVRRKDEFMAMLGHELRNPLAPIQTALQLMRLRGDRHATRERAVIERQMNHLAHLVDDLLDVSRITRGKIRLTKAPVELAEVLIRAIEMATPLLEQRAHRLVVEVPPEGMLVYADSDRLAQLFSNLLTNAAKYTEPHGNIRVSACWRDGFAEIEVVDDGIGIAPEMLPRIFELFVQSPQAIDRAQGGLGIGLKLVQSLVELHGGRVAVHSEGLGKGSRFMVSLPAPPEGAEASTAAAAGVRPADSGDRRRILVVDDNQDAADLLADILRAAGHQVESSYDGPNALARLTSFAPEVALLDIGLPVMDGYELAQQLRERLAGQIRLIAVTGYGTERDRERTREAGFEHHFIKPLDVGLLLAAIAGQPTAAAAE